MKKINGYWIVLCIITFAIVIGHQVSSIIPLSDILMNVGSEELEYPFSVYGYWIGMDISQCYNYVNYMLMPVFCLLGIMGVKKNDEYSKNLLLHMGVGGVSAILPQCIDFCLTCCFLPLVIPDASTVLFSIKPRNFLGELYYSHPILYMCVFMAIEILFACMFALIGIYILDRLHSKYMTIILISIILFVIDKVLELTNKRQFCYKYLLNPGQPLENIKLTNYLVVLLTLIAIILVLRKLKKRV